MSNFQEENVAETSASDVKCKDCGALLLFAPGTNSLACKYCGAINEIEHKPENSVIEEIDYEKFLSASNIPVAEQKEMIVVKCDNCGASTTLKENISSDNCPFCDTPLIVKGGSTSITIKPKYVLPFQFDKKKAFESYKTWINKLWFAPSDLKKKSDDIDKLNGMYIPYWTYDAQTRSTYTGSRGDNYTVYVPRTVTDSQGKTRTEMVAQVQIRWTSVSGLVDNTFDDVLVLASNSLPEKYTYALEPWDMKKLVSFSEKYLSGFRTEMYQVDLRAGFDKGKTIMNTTITETVRRNIGGDHQRVDSVNSVYNNITFKHILLPIWISALKYNDKVYRFLINGDTGEVQGERPYSWIKITLTILAGLLVIGAGALFLYSKNR